MTAAELPHEHGVLPVGSTDSFGHVTDIPLERQEDELWRPVDGIRVSRDITVSDLEDFQPNPIYSHITGLEAVSLHSLRHTHDGENIRKHRLYTVARGGFQFAMEITDPAEGEAEYVILSFPGFTEPIEGPIRQAMHAELSSQFSQGRIVSIGSNGIGMTGSRYGWNERSLHTVASMGSQRLSLGKAIGGSVLPLLNMGTSMGTKVAHHLAEENTFGEPIDGKLNLKGQYYLSPALVDPSKVIPDMGIRFAPGLFVDIFKELAFKTPLSEAAVIIRAARKYGLSRGDLTAMFNQAFDLLHGTKEERISQVVGEVPTIVVAGEKDSLAQLKMWGRLERTHDGMLHVVRIKHRGHGLAMRPGKACPKLASAGQVLLEAVMDGDSLLPTAS